MQDTPGDVRTNSLDTHSRGSLQMDKQRQIDQLEPIYNNSVQIQDIAFENSREQWTIEKGGKRSSRRSMLAARHEDDGDDGLICFVLVKGHVNH